LANKYVAEWVRNVQWVGGGFLFISHKIYYIFFLPAQKKEGKISERDKFHIFNKFYFLLCELETDKFFCFL
jgi:hypothetical protein